MEIPRERRSVQHPRLRAMARVMVRFPAQPYAASLLAFSLSLGMHRVAFRSFQCRWAVVRLT